MVFLNWSMSAKGQQSFLDRILWGSPVTMLGIGDPVVPVSPTSKLLL